MRHRFQRQVMRAFEASARLQSFERAADELTLSTAELRDNIRTMEKQLGVRLFENGETAVLTRAGVEIQDAEGRLANREIRTVQIDTARIEKGGHKHFMAKEIAEQPTVLADAIRERLPS